MSSVFAVFFSLTCLFSPRAFAAVQENTQTGCLSAFAALQDKYQHSSVQMTVIGSDTSGMSPYRLLHLPQGKNFYTLWEHLNGEIKGYALRNGSGFDYNHDRSFLTSLSWHPTSLWDRLLSPDTTFKDYVCVFTGRARLAGHKVSLLRLIPQDGLRYGYLVASDDETSLPVEITVLEPQGGIVSRLLAVDSRQAAVTEFPVDEALFERYAMSQSKSLPQVQVWPELHVPKVFALTDAGVLTENGGTSLYQEFSDGLNTFRVYRSARTSMLLPAVSTGVISVFRKADSRYEYAVTGEIPLRLCERILAGIGE